MEIASRTEALLGTNIEIKLPVQDASLFSQCFIEIKRIEQLYSRFLVDSQLSRLNQNLGVWLDISSEFVLLLTTAQEFNKKTNGNFDITLKSVLDNLGYDREYSFKRKQSSAENIFASSLSSAEAIKIDSTNCRVLLTKEIDFGGFGKGFALDQVAHLLVRRGVDHFYINAGGDIFAKKGKSEDQWEILLEHPDDPAIAIGKIYLDNCAIAGSAPNRRKWGNDFHHLINTKTRLPATGVKAIFVTAKTGIEADAYATALFTAGFQEGIALSKSLPVEILIVSSENKMFKSEGFNAELFG